MALGYHVFMLLHNASEWSKSKPLWLAVLSCFALTALAVGFRMLIHEMVQPNLPFQLFYISVIVSAFYFGWVYGLLSAILGTFAGFFFFIKPYYSFAIPSESDLYVIAVNLSTMMMCVIMIEYLQRSGYVASILLKASNTNYKLYVRSENHLLNLKREVSQYEKLIALMTTSEDLPILWANPFEILCYFESGLELIPGSVRQEAQGTFLNLFSHKQQPAVLGYLNLCLEAGSDVEFSFNWPFSEGSGELVLGRLSPIQIDGNKSMVFSISPQAHLQSPDSVGAPLQEA